MTNLFDFAAMVASHPLLKWELWPTYGTAGVLLAAVVGLAVEVRPRGARPSLDLGRRTANALAWERSPRSDEAALSPLTSRFAPPLAESREGVGWQVEVRGRRSPEQNGDFFDTVELDEDHLAFFLGDVSGRGLPAALYQASCKALLRFATFTPGRTVAAVEEVNSVLCQREPDGRFAALTYGVLEISTGRVSLVSAGHTEPLLQRADGTTNLLAVPLRLPLGMTSRPDYKAVQLTLENGDRLLLSTDGVMQARDRTRQVFGGQRLRSASYHGREAPLGSWAEQVMDQVDRFNFRCTDDRTLLALAYTTEIGVEGEE